MARFDLFLSNRASRTCSRIRLLSLSRAQKRNISHASWALLGFAQLEGSVKFASVQSVTVCDFLFMVICCHITDFAKSWCTELVILSCRFQKVNIETYN